jgi:endonuclease YncB( thermonuclease family)
MLTLLVSAILAQASPIGRVQDLTSLVAEEVFQATVISVEDGDSLVVRPLTGGEPVRVYIAGVDAPEMSQPWGAQARSFLSELVVQKTVTVRLKAVTERLAGVEVNGLPVSLSLIRNGMAWYCSRFAQENDLVAAETEARRAKRGLWREPQPTAPWVYRSARACWSREKTASNSPRQPDFSGIS